ncbi:L-seryl-tRNA(Sec) selenium transferase [Planctomycetota bacterium]
MDDVQKSLLRKLPSVDSILADPMWVDRRAEMGDQVLVDAIREAIEALRSQITDTALQDASETELRKAVAQETSQRLDRLAAPFYRPVINATGIILHTALGRAVLAPRALEQVRETLQGYSLLQIDPETGKRSARDQCIEWLLQQLTGAEAATVVNNNAAATAIVLNTVARGREVIVSRGQLVEIGGSFRLPEIMAFSGAKLVEVGATNRTHPRDYENAITENTAAILRVHPSNYKIEGFSSEVPGDVLANIAHDHGLVFIDDVGAGSLIDFSQFGFEPEPTLPESILHGADIVTSSADKLIGASQGGIILGQKKWVDAVRKNQFARIVRVGKLTLAVLEATLKLFLDKNLALRHVPTLQMLRCSSEDIRKQAEELVSAMEDRLANVQVTVQAGFSQMGSGSLPAQNLATTLIALSPQKISAVSLAKQLRLGTPAIFARIKEDRVLIDPRTLRDGDDVHIMNGLTDILGSKP